MANVQLTVDDLQTVTWELLPVAERWKAIGCALVLVRNFLEQLQGMMLCLCPASSENHALNRTGVTRALTGCELYNFPNIILLVLGQCRSIAIWHGIYVEEARRRKSGLHIPRTALNWGICQFIGSTIRHTFEHFLSRLLVSKSHTKSSDALDCMNIV